MGPYGPIWAHKGHKGPYGPLWAHMGPARALEEREKFKKDAPFFKYFGVFFGSIGAHMGPARALEEREKFKKHTFS